MPHTAAYRRERARYEGHCHEGSFDFEGKSQESRRLFCSEGDIERKLNTSEEQESLIDS